ncbi:MAG: hypothetical protein ABIF77_22135 [bacterium]
MRITRRTRRRFPVTSVVSGWLIGLLAVGFVGLAHCQPSPDTDPEDGNSASDTDLAADGELPADLAAPEPLAAFESVAEAWRAADHTTLSELVAPAGVRIAITPQTNRVNSYSPSQAFYFFKGFFRSNRTESFEVSRWQEDIAGGQVHVVVDWLHERTGADALVEDRLYFALAHGQAGWGLTEIQMFR